MVGSYELMAGILDVVPQPVWVVEQSGNILFANPAAVAVLGYRDASELVGLQSHETVHYKHLDGTPYPAEQCPMLAPLRTGETVHDEVEWFVRRDGSMFPIAWWSAPLQMATGRGAVLAFTDVTERRGAEHAARAREAAEIRASEARRAQLRVLEKERSVRRQVAQDLHDGAQQRLVTVLIALQLAREVVDLPQRAGELIDQASGRTREALVELRELAAGVYPAVLTDHGLAAAVRALADRGPLPVTVTDTTQRRFADAVESHGYFLIAEALTNAVKHAHASRLDVTIEVVDGVLLICVYDDGVGGAAPTERGSGLHGLADRLAALGGELELRSRPGRGTTVRASIPVDTSGQG